MQKTLVDSHVFPESFYKYSYTPGEPRRLIDMSLDSAKPLDCPPMQKGYNEPLMCASCDNEKVGAYDTFIARWLRLDLNYDEYVNFWSKRNGSSFIPEGSDGVRLRDIDFARFRIFHLSLLWRFHIAQGDQFSAVALPADAAEQIRTMILNDDPGDRFFFPCVLIHLDELFAFSVRGVSCPIVSTEPMLQCRAIALGFVWLWALVPDASQHPLSSAMVSPCGEMHVVRAPQIMKKRLMCEHVGRYYKTIEKPNAHLLNRWGFTNTGNGEQARRPVR